jgi:CBS domain containing-hemolysin-like protein
MLLYRFYRVILNNISLFGILTKVIRKLMKKKKWKQALQQNLPHVELKKKLEIQRFISQILENLINNIFRIKEISEQ